MRLPWVSRKRYDFIISRQTTEYHGSLDRLRRCLADEQAAVIALTRQLENESKRTDKLTDLLVEMRRDGFNAVPQPDAMPNPEPDLPSQITEAIMARSTRKSDLERELYRYAIRTYTGSNAEDVAGTIWHGGDPQEDE